MVSRRRALREPEAGMSGLRSRATAALISLVTMTPCSAGEGPSGFNHCAPPLRPACIDDPVATDACDHEMQAFTRTVFKYRACLEKESMRAVREANDAIDAWKCRTGELRCR